MTLADMGFARRADLAAIAGNNVHLQSALDHLAKRKGWRGRLCLPPCDCLIPDLRTLPGRREGMGMDKVVIYTLGDCSECAQLKRWLSERAIEFEERNVTEHPEYANELRAHGIVSTPAVLIGDTPWLAFGPTT